MKGIVTGASGGLGLEFAKLLAADGIDLVLVARSGDKLESIAADLRSRCNIAVDTVTQDLGVFDAAARIVERAPSCDILINNAGFASNGPFDSLPPARLREELLLDVVTLTELTRAYVTGMHSEAPGASSTSRRPPALCRGHSRRSITHRRPMCSRFRRRSLRSCAEAV